MLHSLKINKYINDLQCRNYIVGVSNKLEWSRREDHFLQIKALQSKNCK